MQTKHKRQRAAILSVAAVAAVGGAVLYAARPRYPAVIRFDARLLERVYAELQVQLEETAAGPAVVVPAGTPANWATAMYHVAAERGLYVLDRRADPPRLIATRTLEELEQEGR